jgi:TldD protein
MPVILTSGFGAVLFHEACGHPLEAAFIARNLSQYANKVGTKVASNLVTLVDNASTIEGVAKRKYDDEGNRTQENVLIKDGILQNYLVDTYNSLSMDYKPNGCGRRESFKYQPTSRMSNTYILNGKSTLQEIIENTKYGLLVKDLGGGQVNPSTGQFNFGVSEGYLIENGEIKHLVQPTSLVGNGMESILNVDMVANDFKMEAGVCGSFSGMVNVGVGQPSLRVSSMSVGGE